MDKDTVLAYGARLDNEWTSTDNAISEMFQQVVAHRRQPLPFHMFDWREDFYAWGRWWAEVKGQWLVGTDEYNAARDWDMRLKQWQAKVPKDDPQPTVSSPVPDQAPSVSDAVVSASNAVGSRISYAVLAGGVLALLYLRRQRKDNS